MPGFSHEGAVDKSQFSCLCGKYFWAELSPQSLKFHYFLFCQLFTPHRHVDRRIHVLGITQEEMGDK